MLIGASEGLGDLLTNQAEGRDSARRSGTKYVPSSDYGAQSAESQLETVCSEGIIRYELG
jgi:hypothetical protein